MSDTGATMNYGGDENAPDKMQQGTAWSKSNMADFLAHAPIHPREPVAPQISIRIIGSDEEIRQYLDGPRLARGIDLLDELLRRKIKYGHGYKTADEAMQWVRDELVAVGE